MGLLDPITKALFGSVPSVPKTPLPSYLRGIQAQNIGKTGYGTLYEILQSQGQTDPTAMNLLMQQIARGGAGQQQAIGSQLASSGWENSGVGAALKQASSGATQNRMAMARAQENQLAEARKRQDLGLLLDLFVGPQMSYAGLNQQSAQANAGLQAQRQANQAGQLGQLLMLFGL